MLRIAIPLAATVGCFSITLFTDRTLLMWYGPTSSAASVAAGNLYWAVACIPVTAMGFITPLVALAISSRSSGTKSVLVWSLVWQCVWLTLACAPVFALIGYLSPGLFEGFGHAPELARQEASYFRALLWVAPASMLEAGLTAFFVGRRITRPILHANIAAAGLNVVLDIWLIFGGLGVPALGVLGAALATTLSMWFKVGIFTILLWRLRSFGRHRRSSWKPNFELMRKIVVPGSTLGIQQLIRSSLFSFIMLVIGAASVRGLAATSATLSLYQLLSIPIIGLATAVTVLTGQGFAREGAVLATQIIRRSCVVGGIAAFILAAVMLVFPRALLSISLAGVVGSERAEIETLAITLLALAAIYGVFDIANMIAGAAVKGIGKTLVILIATAVPGFLAVSVGWATAPEADAAAKHWWLVLIGWAGFQAVIVGTGLWQMLRARQLMEIGVEGPSITPR